MMSEKPCNPSPAEALEPVEPVVAQEAAAASGDRRRSLLGGEGGAVALEWALLLGGIAIPSYWVLKLALNLLLAHYRMMTTLNSLPFF